MGRTFIRQSTQIRKSDVYDGTLAAGSTLQSGASTIQDDLNALRSQINRILRADGSLNWYDDVVTVNSKKRSLRDLNFDLDELEEQKTLRRVTVLTDVAVPAGQAYVVLNVAGGEAPSEVAAVAVNVDGAVVAQSALNGGAFEVAELDEIAGPDAISPKNKVLIRDSSNGETIQSANREVFGLLQYESTGADGAAFNDTSAGRRVKISFVRQNATFDDLEGVPIADIEGLSINYAYVSRVKFDNLPEEAWLAGSGFVDQSASVSLTLNAAIDNQSGAATQVGKNILWTVDDNFRFAFQDPGGAVDIFAVKPAIGGDEVELNVGVLDINNSTPADFSGAIQVNTGGAGINLGVSAGVIESGSGDLRVLGTAELLLDDGNQAGSTWSQATGIKLSDTTAEWDAFEVAFGGELSLLKAIGQSKRRPKTFAAVTGPVAADTDVGGVAGGSNLDAQLPDMSLGNFLTDYDVFLNGKLLRPGANSVANNDYYPGTSLANGQLKFEFQLLTNDQIAVTPYIR